MKLSHLNGLRALEATLRNGTFRAAAEELGVTVAAVGQQIRSLEEYLGLTLFDRLPSGAKPTDKATAVASRLTVAFTQIEDVLSELGYGREHGRLRISLSHFMMDDWLSERIPRFHERNPNVDVGYVVTEELADLLKGDADFAVRFSSKPGPEYEYVDLHRSAFMPLCTPEFADAHNLSPDTKDLTGVPLFQFHEVTSDPAWVGWPEILKQYGLTKADPGQVQKVSGYRVAASSGGLVLCGLTESFNDLKEGRLVAPLGPRFVAQFSYGYRLVWPAGRSLSRPMWRFRNWILEERDAYVAEASTMLGVALE